MKVVVTGANGQVGWELQQSRPPNIELLAFDHKGLDITRSDLVRKLIYSEKPDWVINAAAYTAVDDAEKNKELAYDINATGAGNIAAACKIGQARLVQLSTDYVFDGEKNKPYQPDDRPNPQSVYGASKQAGEEAVLSAMDDVVIMRTSWVYSQQGNNFVKTMLRLMSSRDELQVIGDQIGCPTWAGRLAVVLWKIVQENLSGIYHWSDYGVASWYDFAAAISEEAVALGLLQTNCNIKPIRSEEYPQAAFRPRFSVLDKTKTVNQLGIEPLHWRSSLRKMLYDLKVKGWN